MLGHKINIKIFLIFFFIFYLFLAVLGLCCCTWAFSSCGEWGLLFIAVCGLLIVVASLVAEHGLQVRGLQQLQHLGSVAAALGPQSMRASAVVAHRLSSCGAQAQLLLGMWNLPRPGIEPMSPALAGGFQGSPLSIYFYKLKLLNRIKLEIN